ncbi:hypothetical protein CR513_27236, partial [Mucuna pruriens]
MSQDENLGDASKPSLKCVALSITKAELGFVQDEHWLFCDSQSANMMTKVVPRGKFEACCEIAELTITST